MDKTRIGTLSIICLLLFTCVWNGCLKEQNRSSSAEIFVPLPCFNDNISYSVEGSYASMMRTPQHIFTSDVKGDSLLCITSKETSVTTDGFGHTHETFNIQYLNGSNVEFEQDVDRFGNSAVSSIDYLLICQSTYRRTINEGLGDPWGFDSSLFQGKRIKVGDHFEFKLNITSIYPEFQCHDILLNLSAVRTETLLGYNCIVVEGKFADGDYATYWVCGEIPYVVRAEKRIGEKTIPWWMGLQYEGSVELKKYDKGEKTIDFLQSDRQTLNFKRDDIMLQTWKDQIYIRDGENSPLEFRLSEAVKCAENDPRFILFKTTEGDCWPYEMKYDVGKCSIGDGLGNTWVLRYVSPGGKEYKTDVEKIVLFGQNITRVVEATPNGNAPPHAPSNKEDISKLPDNMITIKGGVDIFNEFTNSTKYFSLSIYLMKCGNISGSAVMGYTLIVRYGEDESVQINCFNGFVEATLESV